MRRTPIVALLAAALVLGLPTALAGKPPPTATVPVDCTDPDPKKHDSVNAALATPAGELTVEIRGMCQERVVVTRDWITLRGTDPEQDGIFGPGPSTLDFFSNALLVRSAEMVRIENLKITGAARRGVFISESDFVELVNCRVVDNDRLGIVVSSGAGVVVRDSVVSGNTGVVALAASRAVVSNSTVSRLSGSGIGLASLDGASLIRADQVTVEAIYGVYAGLFGQVTVIDSSVDGSLYAEREGLIMLHGVTQVANPLGYNFVDLDSTLQLEGGSAILGPTWVESFSNMLLVGGSTLDGSLVCRFAGDAYCDDPVTQVTGSANCGQCAKP